MPGLTKSYRLRDVLLYAAAITHWSCENISPGPRRSRQWPRALRAAPDAKYFGEGITILKGRLYQLIWREPRCLVYDPASFERLDELTYDGEGWELTNDGRSLITSDGSE